MTAEAGGTHKMEQDQCKVLLKGKDGRYEAAKEKAVVCFCLLAVCWIVLYGSKDGWSRKFCGTEEWTCL